VKEVCEDLECGCSECFCISDERGFASGCVEDGRIWVAFIASSRPGGMKSMISELVERYGIDRVVFTNVISAELLRRLLKHPENIVRAWKESGALFIEVKWREGG